MIRGLAQDCDPFCLLGLHDVIGGCNSSHHSQVKLFLPHRQGALMRKEVLVWDLNVAESKPAVSCLRGLH